MSTFKALNIESDDEEDVEVDDTKEIQIEEALKLYQNALKLHSEGAASYEQADAAYRALFDSDIFKYPESQSELKRVELFGPASVPEKEDYLLDEDGVPVIEYVGTGESAQTTLSQIIHLAHKNYGDFLLQSLQRKLQQSETQSKEIVTREIVTASTAALNAFVEALDKDDTDLELWRRTSRVGRMLGSFRIARYCLEAVLDGDEAGIENVLLLPGLAESLANEQLRELLGKLQDRLSMLQGPLSAMQRKKLSNILKKKLDAHELFGQEIEDKPLNQLLPSPNRSVLRPANTWAELGDIVYRQMINEQHGSAVDAMLGLGVSFGLSDEPDVDLMQTDEPIAHERTSVDLSSQVESQFPGLGNGEPTAPVPAFSVCPNAAERPLATHNTASALPTRKRSGDAAGLQDAGESGRSKSKRIRARESLVDTTQMEDETTIDLTQAEWTLSDLDFLDGSVAEVLSSLLQKLDIPQPEASQNDRKTLRTMSARSEGDAAQRLESGIQTASLDLYHFFDQFADASARMLLLANGDLDPSSDAHVKPSGRTVSGTAVAAKSQPWPEMDEYHGLQAFMQHVNNSWFHINEVVVEWVLAFLRPGPGLHKSSYASRKWEENFKTILVRTIVAHDEYIYRETEIKLFRWADKLLQNIHARSDDEHLIDIDLVHETVEIVQALFELHLDIYSLIKEPNSGVDAETVTIQGDRTDRWADLAREAMNIRSTVLQSPSLKDELNLRYLWAATHNLSISSEIARDHMIACWQELRAIFRCVGDPSIELQNNAVMSQLCVESVDRELARLTTQDFFVKVFDAEQQDLTVIIESLEPLLEALRNCGSLTNGSEAAINPRSIEASQDDIADDVESKTRSDDGHSLTVSSELLSYLKNSSVPLKVSLWQRLREAYEGINYEPMVVCCYFRIIELLLTELKATSYTKIPITERQPALLKYLRLLHNLVRRLVESINANDNALECMDMARIENALAAMTDMLKLLHSATLFLDDTAVGLRLVPSGKDGHALRSFTAVTDVIQQLQIHSWVVIYKLINDAMAQNASKFGTADKDSFVFLRSLHNMLGARALCGASNRCFMKLLKQEYIRMRNEGIVPSKDLDVEFAQVLYDMHGMKCFSNPVQDLKEHHCMQDAFVDRTSAMQAVNLLLSLVSKMKMADLVKHPLKDTIEKVHGVVVKAKKSSAVVRNMAVYKEFLKSPINPVDLYRCLRGEGELSLAPVSAEQAVLASKGWYFLMGHLQLARWRSQKRTSASATEDLDTAVAFFMQDLEYSMDNWETWFRLAQAYDSKIEETVSWSAEKLNQSMPELILQQRQAIHSYTMAVALAMRSAEPGEETTKKLGELYADFAMRIYASSREPFGHEAFSLENDKFFSLLERSASPIAGRKWRAMTEYQAWKFAAELFRRAIAINPNNWNLHYYLSKCLWKMHDRGPEGSYVRGTMLTPEEVIEEIIRSIELLPNKKDSRREPREPILEPHYKLVSVTHKMVVRGDLDPPEACTILMATPYAAKVEHVSDLADWERYILRVIKNLRVADKSHWHHRMIARTAHIVFHDGNEPGDALAAKHELTQQMFTKTMVLNVWRPEHERPGRHFVYTSRYTRFFVRLLEQLEDRGSLDALARRVRKKAAEFFKHADVWSEVCQTYIRVLRLHGSVPLGHETAVFSGISHDEFVRRKDPLEAWCQDSGNSTNPTLEALQEALELKKTNQNLLKPGVIDDLIGDAYAYLYDTVGRSLSAQVEAQEKEEKAAKTAQIQAQRQTLPAPSPQRNPIMSMAHLMNMDGATESPQLSALTTPMDGVSAAPTPPALVKTESDANSVAPAAATTAQPRRKIGVGRREIRLCAEACVSKSSTVPAATGGGGTRDLVVKGEVRVVIESSRSKADRRPSRATIDVPKSGSAIGEDAEDADDESELSDVDEDLVLKGGPGSVGSGVITRPMFPGLMRRNVVSSSDDEENNEEADEEDDGAEGDDGDDEEGGEDVEGEEEVDGDGEEGEDVEGEDDDDGEGDRDVAMAEAGDEGDEVDEDGDGDGFETAEEGHGTPVKLGASPNAARRG